MSSKKITKRAIIDNLLEKNGEKKIVVLFPSSDVKRHVVDDLDDDIRNDSRLRLDGRFPFKVTPNAITAFSNKVTFGIATHEAYFTNVFDDIYHYEEANEQGKQGS